MNKKVYEAVKKRSEGLCELCGSNQSSRSTSHSPWKR